MVEGLICDFLNERSHVIIVAAFFLYRFFFFGISCHQKSLPSHGFSFYV